MSKTLLLSLLACAVITSCLSGGGSAASTATNTNSTTARGAQDEVVSTSIDSVKYAKGYSIKRVGNIKLLEISDPTGGSKALYRYALTPRGEQLGKIPKGYTQIETPVRRLICMTTLQLSSLIKLGETDRIVGVTSTRFLQHKSLSERMRSGDLSRIGIEGEFDTEVVLSIAPDLIFVSPFKRGGYDAVENLGIPMLAYLGYKESSPLGQAEWIKLVGLLIDKESEAEECFNKIERRYIELKALVANVNERPKVLSGEMHSGNWYVVGGESYLAQLFRDAGGDYFMQSDSESGGFYVDYETVYTQGHNADFWRIVNSFNGDYSYRELLAADGRYRDFRAFQKRQVLYCNLREVPFYENTPMEPEVVLADLIKAFHPQLLNDHKPVYYKLLK